MRELDQIAWCRLRLVVLETPGQSAALNVRSDGAHTIRTLGMIRMPAYVLENGWVEDEADGQGLRRLGSFRKSLDHPAIGPVQADDEHDEDHAPGPPERATDDIE